LLSAPAWTACAPTEPEPEGPAAAELVYELGADAGPEETLAIVQDHLADVTGKQAAAALDPSGRIVVSLWDADPSLVKEELRRAATFRFALVVPDPVEVEQALERGRAWAGREIAPTGDAMEPYLLVYAEDWPAAADATFLSRHIQSAALGFAPTDGHPVVNFAFDEAGAEAFARLTTENVGRRFAVMLDGEVVTAPAIRTPITGGTGYIEGGFTVESADSLANLIDAGVLPEPLTLVEERSSED
jgi:preprotein translocase subunit SecD